MFKGNIRIFAKEKKGDPVPDLFFREIIPQLVNDYSPFKLAMLGIIVKKKGKVGMYESLRHSLRKIQWVKLTGSKAVYLESEMMKVSEPNFGVLDPLRQITHSL